ncbi:MAG: hypothetical protein OEZ21_00890 [Candidatus Bathyarchaeota archaeon]|nr:hypothetical protein [Candidatus Bathyarchaeota archaeon]MDH5745497.1 hypothetical protein [Candidatus Bathyarchaeota archaeon]
MSKAQVPRFLVQAEEKEKTYDWLEAVEFYKKALAYVLKQKDFLKAGDVQERIGHCFYRAAFQAESREEFKEGMQRAVEAYEEAHGLYEKLADEQKIARIFRCDAMPAYIGYWLAAEAPEKKRLINECWRLTKEALKSLDETGSALEYGETYNQLSSSADHRYVFESNFQFREELIREAVQYGERAIILLSTVNAPDELARAYVKTGMYLSVLAWYFASDMDEKESYYKKGLARALCLRV